MVCAYMNARVKRRSLSWPVTKDLLTCVVLAQPCESLGSPPNPVSGGQAQSWSWGVKHQVEECFTATSISIAVSQDGGEYFVDAPDLEAELTASTSHTDLLIGNTAEENDVLSSLAVALGPCNIASPTPGLTKDATSVSKCAHDTSIKWEW